MIFTIRNPVEASKQDNRLILTDNLSSVLLKDNEQFFDKIKNTAVKYAFDRFGYKMLILNYFDDQEIGVREFNISLINLRDSDDDYPLNRLHLCNLSLNFSNFQSKETEIRILGYNDILIITLLKSKTDNKVFFYFNYLIDARLDSDSPTGKCSDFRHLFQEVGASMWNDKKNLIVTYRTSIYHQFAVFHECPKGDIICMIYFKETYEFTVQKVYPEYSWSEFDFMHNLYSHDMDCIFTRNYSNLFRLSRSIVHYDTIRITQRWIVTERLDMKNYIFFKPQDVQFFVIEHYNEPYDYFIVTLTSIVQKKMVLLLIDSID